MIRENVPVDDSLERLQQRLDYQFTNIELLQQALTHRSFGKKNNERLEFLGDSVVNLAAARLVYLHHPNASEGELTRHRSLLVRKESLAAIARSISLQSYLRFGGSMLGSGAYKSDSILEDAFEALFGAIYLDSNLGRCLEVITPLFEAQMDVLAGDQKVDSKTRLQEMMQALGKTIPQYAMIERVGPGHDLRFRVSCVVELLDEVVIGEGKSRRAAEQEAAAKTLDRLKG